MKKNILFALAVILLAGVIAVTRVMTRRGGDGSRGDHGRGDDHPAAGQGRHL